MPLKILFQFGAILEATIGNKKQKMTVQRTVVFFQNLQKKAHKNKNNTYSEFLMIFSALEQKELSQEQLATLERKLSSLRLTEKQPIETYKRKLIALKSFLNEEYALVTTKHFTVYGLVYGVVFGVILGLVLSNFINDGLSINTTILAGAFIGITIGGLFGILLDAKALKKGRVLGKSNNSLNPKT